jgi:hypothetical protein
MEAVREAWTDERMDDLNHRVDSIDRRMEDGFAEIRTDFRAVRNKMSTQFAAQQRMMIQLFGGMFATMVFGFLGTIATIIARS